MKMKTDAVIQTLKELPEEIKEASLHLLNLEEELAVLKVKMELWEMEQLRDIAEAVNGGGKPVFSNEARRKAELARRKSEGAEYSEMSNRMRELVNEIGMAKIEVRFQRDRLRIGEAIAALLAGEFHGSIVSGNGNGQRKEER